MLVENSDNAERQQGEMAFVAAAFTQEEAWCSGVFPDINDNSNNNYDDNNNNDNDNNHPQQPQPQQQHPTIHRRLILPGPCPDDDDKEETTTALTNISASNRSFVNLILNLCMIPGYPEREPLQVSLQLDHGNTYNNGNHNNRSSSSTFVSFLLKLAYDVALPKLETICQTKAASLVGSEAIFSVLTAADDWIREDWPLLWSSSSSSVSLTVNQNEKQQHQKKQQLILGRRLIYSHHIISNKKIKDLQELARQYDLTGFLRTGWPGLIIIEGLDQDCIAFQDTIKKWSWQYLVTRGEMQQTIPSGENWEQYRRFPNGFQQVSDISAVADACRQANLESLFRTSMKIYSGRQDDEGDDDDGDDSDPTVTARCRQQQRKGEINSKLLPSSLSHPPSYGALVHVDHMNNVKGYRKWLRKTSQETGCRVMLFHANEEQQQHSHQKPLIVVALVGENRDTVSAFLKKWRTAKVDVDSRGQPCLERCMQILVQGYLNSSSSNSNKTLSPQQKMLDGGVDKTRDKILFAITESETRQDLLPWIEESVGSTSWAEQSLLFGLT